MAFNPDLDIPHMLSDFGTLVVQGNASAPGILDTEVIMEAFGQEEASVIMAGPAVRVEHATFPNAKVESLIQVGGKRYKVRDRKATSDGKTVWLFLQEVA